MTALNAHDAAYPPREGRCERCQSAPDAEAAFCVTCGLRLSAEVPRSPEIQELERQWTEGHPDEAYAFMRLVTARQRLARRKAARNAAPRPAQDSNRRREALENLDYWTLRGRMLWDMTTEADAKAREAYEACRSVGVPDPEIRARMAAPGNPRPQGAATQPRSRGRQTAAAPSAAAASGGGGFLFFYSESGLDVDGDGDVDGGLIDTITGGGDGGTLLDGLSSLFG
jgi:hypothetical protein